MPMTDTHKSVRPFDYSVNFKTTDFRRHPDLYQIGRGEQGVLSVEPYKSEILPLWRFKNPDVARTSSDAIYRLFERYRDGGDFVGMDMARKFLQMGFTRARRYANHRSGRKWNQDRDEILPFEPDPLKAEAAQIFYRRYQEARNDPIYCELMQQHRDRYECQAS